MFSPGHLSSSLLDEFKLPRLRGLTTTFALNKINSTVELDDCGLSREPGVSQVVLVFAFLLFSFPFGGRVRARLWLSYAVSSVDFLAGLVDSKETRVSQGE